MFYLTTHSTHFILRLYGVGHIVEDHSDSERGNPLPPHGLLFLIKDDKEYILKLISPVVVVDDPQELMSNHQQPVDKTGTLMNIIQPTKYLRWMFGCLLVVVVMCFVYLASGSTWCGAVFSQSAYTTDRTYSSWPPFLLPSEYSQVRGLIEFVGFLGTKEG